MREIVSVGVGGCGVNLVQDFFGSFGAEDVDSMFFRQSQKEGFHPRGILVDLDPTIDQFRNQLGWQNGVFAQYGAGGNWAKGMYTEGAELIDQVMDNIRKEVELCERPQGFHMWSGLGGGTGSGFGALISTKIREEYPEIPSIWCLTLDPSSDRVIEPYNVLLALNYAIEESSLVIPFDNDAVRNRLCSGDRSSLCTSFQFNRPIIDSIKCVTDNIRDLGSFNLSKLISSLCPFPRSHIPLVSYTHDPPNLLDGNQSFVDELFSPHSNMTVSNLWNHGKCIAAYAAIENPPDIDTFHDTFLSQSSNPHNFVQWLPDNLKYGLTSQGHKTQASMLLNSSEIGSLFSPWLDKFDAMFRRKAFLSWYMGEGMDEMEFEEARTNLEDLISEYSDYEDPPVEEKEILEKALFQMKQTPPERLSIVLEQEEEAPLDTVSWPANLHWDSFPFKIYWKVKTSPEVHLTNYFQWLPSEMIRNIVRFL